MVDYWGKRLPRSAVLLDKAQFYRKWPNRDYQLERDTVRIEQHAPRQFRVTFDYHYNIDAGDNKTYRSGLGRARLTLERVGQGLRVAAEDGEVLKQN